MVEFVPINWFNAGFESTVDYIKYAGEFEHDFSAIIVISAIYSAGRYTLTCVQFCDTIRKFRSDITPNWPGFGLDKNDESEFAYIYNGVNYMISTDILMDEINHGINPTDEIRQKSDELIQNINLPDQIIKMAMIAINIEL